MHTFMLDFRMLPAEQDEEEEPLFPSIPARRLKHAKLVDALAVFL